MRTCVVHLWVCVRVCVCVCVCDLSSPRVALPIEGFGFMQGSPICASQILSSGYVSWPSHTWNPLKVILLVTRQWHKCWGIWYCYKAHLFLCICSFWPFKICMTSCPGWCGSVDWVSAYELKGRWFNFQSEPIPEFQARPPVEDMWEATDWCISCTLMFLSLSSPLSKNK